MRIKIGVFDSGVGGITVLNELQKKFPSANYVYLGDTAHLPYGAKSPAQIRELSMECARNLKEQDIGALVVACNTASSLALNEIRKVMHPIPVFGVVEPGIEAALSALELIRRSQKSAPLLVLATRATIRSRAYGDAFRKIIAEHPEMDGSRFPVIEQACPVLVPIIEEGWIDHPVLHQSIAEYVKSHRVPGSRGVALLACTHYPWIHQAFEKALPGWVVVNSAQAVTESLARSDLFSNASDSSSFKVGSEAKVEWRFTDPDVVPEFARRFIVN